MNDQARYWALKRTLDDAIRLVGEWRKMDRSPEMCAEFERIVAVTATNLEGQPDARIWKALEKRMYHAKTRSDSRGYKHAIDEAFEELNKLMAEWQKLHPLAAGPMA